jgi:Ribbon-helix-helix protein, copG family
MTPRATPISVRLSKGLEDQIDQEARRTGRSRSAVLEALAGEALRTRQFPGIAFRGTDWERRAWVIGTALDGHPPRPRPRAARKGRPRR